MDASGLINYANSQWFDLLGHSRCEVTPMSWFNLFAEEDLPKLTAEWAKLSVGEPVNFEIRLRKPWERPKFIPHEAGEDVEPTWVIAAGYAEMNDDGKTIRYIAGCIVDIR